MAVRAESVTRSNHLFDFIGSACMKELRAPVPDIEWPEERRAHHGHGRRLR